MKRATAPVKIAVNLSPCGRSEEGATRPGESRSVDSHMIEQEYLANGSAGGEEAFDLFVSYAHADDEVPRGAEAGWVTTLVTELRKVLRRRLGGGGARIWMDHELASNQQVSDTLMDRVRRSRTLVLVLSPGYLRSDWCQRELAAFLDRARTLGRADCIFPIELEPIPRQQLLDGITELTPQPFWEKNLANGVTRLAGYPVPKLDEESHYWIQVNLLADRLKSHLGSEPPRPLAPRDLPPLVPSLTPHPVPATPNANGQERLEASGLPLSVYLHAAPEDQNNAELIAQHLESHGLTVLMTPEPEDGKTYLDCLRDQRESLQSCDGFLMVRGESPSSNLMAAFQYAQQAFGVRRTDKWAAAIQLPPPGRHGLPIRSPNLLHVDCSGGFSTEALHPFLSTLRVRHAAIGNSPAQGPTGHV